MSSYILKTCKSIAVSLSFRGIYHLRLMEVGCNSPQERNVNILYDHKKKIA